MNATPELVALVERDRRRAIEHDRLARVLACVKACCSTSRLDRVARVLRLAPASC